jgi:hypothetical protein
MMEAQPAVVIFDLWSFRFPRERYLLFLASFHIVYPLHSSHRLLQRSCAKQKNRAIAILPKFLAHRGINCKEH